MDEKTEFWAVVELFGHQQLAGKLKGEVVGSASFVRVDVPETENSLAFTRILNPSAIYAINPCDEETARYMVNNLRAEPVFAYSARAAVMLSLKPEDAARLSAGEEDENW